MGLRTMLTIHPKTNVYYFRKRIPQELVDLIGKKEITKSLGTKDVKEAKRLVVEAEAEFNEFLESQRANLHVPLHERQKIVADLVASGLLPPETKDITPDVIFQLSEKISLMLDTYMQEGTKRKLEHKAGIADDDPAVHMLDSMTERCVMLAKKLRLYEHMYREKGFLPSSYLTARKNNKLVIPDTPHNQIENIIRLDVPTSPIALPTPSLPTANVASHNQIRLPKALEEWAKAKKRPEGTLGEWQKAVKMFIELYGDIPIVHITKRHAREYREALVDTPIVPPKLSGKTLPELMTMTKEGKLEGCAKREAGTVNKYIRALSSIINHVLKNYDDVPIANPFSNMLLDEEESNKVPYNDEDLQVIFTSSLYTQKDTPRDEYFWFPLITLYSGARPSELAQLLLPDIQKKGTVWYLDINTVGKRKKVKTKSAKRQLPIHSELIRCGFLQYVEQMKTEKQEQVFPNFDLSRGSRRAKEYSRKYSRYCDKIAAGTTIKSEGKSFYSLRHRFEDMLRETEMSLEAQKRFMGHSMGKGNMMGYYGHGHSMATMKKFIERVKYPCLDLSGLYVEGTKKKTIRLVKKS